MVSRIFAIPFYGFFVDVVVTLEGGYLFPFDRVDDLRGLRATAVVFATLW